MKRETGVKLSGGCVERLVIWDVAPLDARVCKAVARQVNIHISGHPISCGAMVSRQHDMLMDLLYTQSRSNIFVLLVTHKYFLNLQHSERNTPRALCFGKAEAESHLITYTWSNRRCPYSRSGC